MNTELHTNEFKLFLNEFYNFFSTLNLDDYQNQPNRYSKSFKVNIQLFSEDKKTIFCEDYAKLFFWRGMIDIHFFKNDERIETDFDETLDEGSFLNIFRLNSLEKQTHDIIWFIDVKEFTIALIDLFKELDNYKTNQKLDIHNSISIMKSLSKTD